jgi:hypothetical protein
MEVVGGIASIGTILGGTIATAKFLHNSVQHIRYASETFEDLSSAIYAFIEVLNRLGGIVRRVQLENVVNCESLEVLLKRYHENFQQWQKEVERFRLDGSESRASKILWRGRVGLKSGRFRDIKATLSDGKTTLNIHLDCIER